MWGWIRKPQKSSRNRVRDDIIMAWNNPIHTSLYRLVFLRTYVINPNLSPYFSTLLLIIIVILSWNILGRPIYTDISVLISSLHSKSNLHVDTYQLISKSNQHVLFCILQRAAFWGCFIAILTVFFMILTSVFYCCLYCLRKKHGQGSTALKLGCGGCVIVLIAVCL